MKIESINDLNVIFFAFRYALGRRTAAPGIIIKTIISSWDEFPIQDKEQFLKETSDFLDRELGNTVSVNEWNEHNEWYKFKDWCVEKIREDKINSLIESKS